MNTKQIPLQVGPQMRKFLLKLKIKGCKEIFIEGSDPGVVAYLEVAFAEAEPYAGALAVALLRQEDLLIKDVIEVQIEEVKE